MFKKKEETNIKTASERDMTCANVHMKKRFNSMSGHEQPYYPTPFPQS